MPRRSSQDDYDDRPRRRSREDNYDDEFDPPARRRGPKRSSALGTVLALLGSFLAIAAVIGLGYHLFYEEITKPKRDRLAQPTPVTKSRPTPRLTDEPEPSPNSATSPVLAPVPSPKPTPTPTPTPPPAPTERFDYITLSNLHRYDRFAGSPKIQFDYVFGNDARLASKYKVFVKTQDGIDSIDLRGPLSGPIKRGTKETMMIGSRTRGLELYSGKIEVWIEQSVGLQSTRVSNIISILN